MKKNPLISVILPTYNRASIIQESIDSVLNQTYQNLELIIVDDGSTDNTNEIINHLRDRRIKYYRLPHNGANSARNYGIQQAKGSYIAFQDSDDLWKRNKLEKQLSTIIATNADIVFCKKNSTKNREFQFFDEGFLPKKSSTFCISTQTLLIKRKVFDTILFDENLTKWQDMEFLYRANKKFKIYSMNSELVIYRLQSDSISNNKEDIMDTAQYILSKHKNLPNEIPNACESIANMLLSLNAKKRTEIYKLIKKYTSNKYIRFKAILNLFGILKIAQHFKTI